MSVRRFLAAVAICVAVAACGGAGATSAGGQPAGGAGSTLPPSGTSAAATPGGSGAAPVTGHVGDKLTFSNPGGGQVDATLVKIFDPATPTDASEAPLPPATHWVGVEVILDNPDYVTDTSEIDGVTSAGTTVTTTVSYQGGSYVLGDGFAGCTQTHGVEQDAQTYTHCEAIPVPDGQTLVKVGVEIPTPFTSTDQATWSVP